MTGVTRRAPINRKTWLDGDDAASQSDNSNGIMAGKTMIANPAMPSRKIARPRMNRVEVLSGRGRTERESPRKMTRIAMTERAMGCNAHARRIPGWIMAAQMQPAPVITRKEGTAIRIEVIANAAMSLIALR